MDSNVLDKKDYELLYSQYPSEINRIHQNTMDDHGFIPSDAGESKHTENWSQGAQYAEMAVTQKNIRCDK